MSDRLPVFQVEATRLPGAMNYLSVGSSWLRDCASTSFRATLVSAVVRFSKLVVPLLEGAFPKEALHCLASSIVNLSKSGGAMAPPAPLLKTGLFLSVPLSCSTKLFC